MKNSFLCDVSSQRRKDAKLKLILFLCVFAPLRGNTQEGGRAPKFSLWFLLAEKVQRDLIDGHKLGVNGTPTLYINGKRVSDNSYESMKSAIEAALKAEATLRTQNEK